MQACSFLTKSLSEFRVNPDGSMDRMSMCDTQFRRFLPPGTRIDVLEPGAPCHGWDPDGHAFTTNVVVLVAIDNPASDPRAEAFAEIRALAEAL